MKLIYCPACHDVVRLLTLKPRTCACGRAFGMYDEDDLHAFVGGSAIPLGFANPSLKKALKEQPVSGDGKGFNAFVIPMECPTVQRASTMHSLHLLIRRRKAAKSRVSNGMSTKPSTGC